MRIDTHQHFWQHYTTDYVWMSEEHNSLKRNFLPEHLLPLLDACKIDGTIAVQARQMMKENKKSFVVYFPLNQSKARAEIM